MNESGFTNLPLLHPPFVKSARSTRRIMLLVMVALLPAVWAAYRFFGDTVLRHLAYSVIASVFSEAASQLAMKKPVTVTDGSAALTGLLMGMSVPASAPYWLAPAGAAVAVLLFKQCFGGLGKNFVNPVLAARVLMMALWSSYMTSFPRPYDAVASATPMAIISGADILHKTPSMMQLFYGEVAGCLGETSALALMAGGIFLVFCEVIDYRIPVGILGSIFLFSSLFAGPGFSPGFSLNFGLYQILSGSAMLAAFFMATDYVTSPVTPAGRWIYSVAIGALVVLFRFRGSFAEGITYAILLMNSMVPLIERFTVPRRFGEVSGHVR